MTKILFIEEDSEIREPLQKQLSSVGFEMVVCGTGPEAMEFLKSENPDLIICDVSNKGIKDCEPLKIVKENDQTFLTPFIVIAPEFDKKLFRSAMMHGADDFITKPLKLEDIYGVITTQLERKQRRKRITEAGFNTLRRNITRSLPHEFNTPLTGILGFSETLKSDLQELSLAEIAEMVNYINDSAKRLKSTAEKFLLYTNLQSVTTGDIQKDFLDNATTVVNRPLIMKIMAELKDYPPRVSDFRVNVTECKIHFFQEYFESVVRELIENAIKFSDAGTRISFTGKVLDGHYQIEITDKGSGIPQEFINEIGAFRQYKRHKYEQQGLGLGLAIVQGAMNLYDAGFEIDSEPGEKTACRLLFNLPE